MWSDLLIIDYHVFFKDDQFVLTVEQMVQLIDDADAPTQGGGNGRPSQSKAFKATKPKNQ